jgi:hypothetical protein
MRGDAFGSDLVVEIVEAVSAGFVLSYLGRALLGDAAASCCSVSLAFLVSGRVGSLLLRDSGVVLAGMFESSRYGPSKLDNHASKKPTGYMSDVCSNAFG